MHGTKQGGEMRREETRRMMRARRTKRGRKELKEEKEETQIRNRSLGGEAGVS